MGCLKGKECGKACIKEDYNCRIEGEGQCCCPQCKRDRRGRKVKTAKAKPTKAKAKKPTKAKAKPAKAKAKPAKAKAKTAKATLTAPAECKRLITALVKAPLKEARRAYLKGSLKCHPDKGGNDQAFSCLKWHYDMKNGKDCGNRPRGCPKPI